LRGTPGVRTRPIDSDNDLIEIRDLREFANDLRQRGRAEFADMARKHKRQSPLPGELDQFALKARGIRLTKPVQRGNRTVLKEIRHVR